MTTKTDLLTKFDHARDALWQALAALDASEATRVCEIFAHMGGWDSLVFEAFRAYVHDIPASAYVYHGVDAANADFVAKRVGFGIAEAKREAEVTRYAIRVLLDAIPAENYADMIHFPWGEESVTAWLNGAIEHEQGHLEEAIRLKSAS